MAVAVGTSPAIVRATDTSSTLTTASFTPANGSYLVAVGMFGWAASVSSGQNITFTDSASGTWTNRVSSLNVGGSDWSGVRIATRPIVTGSSMTVTATFAGTQGSGNSDLMLAVYVVTGADTSTVGASKTATFTGTNMTTSLTTTVSGALVFGGVAMLDSQATENLTLGANTAWAPMTGTNPYHNGTTIGDTLGVFKSSSTVGTPGATTYGVTASATPGNTAGMALLEIVPVTNSNISAADTSNPAADTATVAATVPAADTGTGTDTAFVTSPVPAADTATGTESAKILVSGAADVGVGDESTTLLSGGSVLKFASDTVSSAESVAPMVINAADTGTAVDVFQTATVGIQGPLPPGPRIVRIGSTT